MRLPVLLVTLASLAVATVDSSAQVYSNHWPIILPDATSDRVGVPSMYPSVITVPRQPDPAARLRRIAVRLTDLAHPRMEDLDILLVPPPASGRPSIILLSDAEGQARFSGGSPARFLNGSRTYVPNDPTFGDGAYRPTDRGNAPDLFPGAPSVTLATDLDALIGMDPTGDWSLYVVDDQPGETGAVGGGWRLDLDIAPAYESSDGPITIDSPAVPGTVRFTQASSVTVGAMSGMFSWVGVTLRGLTHARPDDLEIWLVESTGRCLLLQADAGGETAVANLTFSMESGEFLTYQPQPDNAPLLSGVVTPPRFRFPSPAPDVEAPLPPGCTEQTSMMIRPQLASYPGGSWTLFIADDRPGADGRLDSWALTFGLCPYSEGRLWIDGASITWPSVSETLTGTFEHFPGAVPVAAIRWRLRMGPTWIPVPAKYAEGPWVPVPAGATTWSLPDVPMQWGVGSFVVDVMDINGNVRSPLQPNRREVNLPEPRYTLSEGATGTFFDLDIVVFNPSDDAARAEVTFLPKDASPVIREIALGPKGRRRIQVKDIPGLESGQISTIVRPLTVTPLIVERTMFWDDRRYGGHAANAVQPATTWYFAEGAQNDFFRTYLLIANANAEPLTVNLEFQIEGNRTGQPLRLTRVIAAATRETIDIGDIPALQGQTFGVRLSSEQEFVAERAMYFGGGSRLWEGGHESTGVSTPSTTWLLAEGATGEFFETYVLVTNPTTYDAIVAMDFLLPDGRVIWKTYGIPPQRRLSINIEHEDPALAATPVSTRVHSSTAPIVVERAMYWPGLPSEWTEAHDGFGLTNFGRVWGLADGRIGGTLAYQTYIMLANPNLQPADVEVLFVRDNGERFTLTVKVAPNSRYTIDASAELPEAWLTDAAEFSNVITATTPTPIGVERATYWNSTDGRHWAGGANVQGTPIAVAVP